MLLKTILIGFAVAAPVGPISVLAIRRALTVSLRAGLLTGFGCAAADACLAAIPAFGLTLVADWLNTHRVLLAGLCGILLLFIGAVMWRHRTPARTTQEPIVCKPAHAFASGFALTIINPANMFAFAAAFAGIGMMDGGFGGHHAALATLGCLIGALGAWTIAVCVPYFWLGTSLERHIQTLTSVCAALLMAGGVLLITRSFLPLF